MRAIKKAYVPINCELHDYLEHFATLGQSIDIVYSDEFTRSCEMIKDAVIFDLTGGRNGEFTHIRFPGGERKIRNDYLISINEVKCVDFKEGNCKV